MTQPKKQTSSATAGKGKKPATELSDAALSKVSGGNMPTAVERSSGGGGGSGRS